MGTKPSPNAEPRCSYTPPLRLDPLLPSSSLLILVFIQANFHKLKCLQELGSV